MAPRPFTPEEDDFLKKRWKEGASAGVIGAELKRTRNSVIGRLHRLKCWGGHKPQVRKPAHPAHQKPSLPLVVRKPMTTLPRSEASLANLKLGPKSKPGLKVRTGPLPVARGLSGTCQYIHGHDPATWYKCGKPSMGSYCEEHYRLCYQPVIPALQRRY